MGVTSTCHSQARISLENHKKMSGAKIPTQYLPDSERGQGKNPDHPQKTDPNMEVHQAATNVAENGRIMNFTTLT